MSVFTYNTTVSSSTGVTPHYAMFGCEAMLPVDWVFATPSVEKRTMYQWTGDMLEEKQRAYKSMRDVQGRRVRRNAQMYKPLTQNTRASCLVWYFVLRIIPGTSHKLRSFWAGPYQVTRLIAPALGGTTPCTIPEKRNYELRRIETILQQSCDSIGS